jgi:hypothetical protein
MRKQILTAIGVLLVGSTAAFASPQWQHSNFNDQGGGRPQQRQQPVNRRNAPPAQYRQYRNAPQQTSNWQRRQNEIRYVKNQPKHHKKAPRFNPGYSRQGRR